MHGFSRLASSCVLLLVLLASPAPLVSAQTLSARPGPFIENAGQLDPQVRHHASLGGFSAWFTDDAIVLRAIEARSAPIGRHDPLSSQRFEELFGSGRHAVTLALRFVGASPSVVVEGTGPVAARHAFYRGADPAAWVSDAPAFGSLVYRGLYPGIDVVVRPHGGGLEYDVHVAPGADLSAFRVAVEGADELALQPDGSLLATTALGTLRQVIPAAWQPDGAGERRPVAARFTLDASGFGLAAEGLEPGLPLVVDPTLDFSTYLGGMAVDIGNALAVDAAGASYLVGSTNSSDFPTVPGPTVLAGAEDVFVTKFDATGSAPLYSVVLGGSGLDQALAVAVRPSGAVVVGGETGSSDWPTSFGAFDTSFAGFNTDGMLFELDAAGGLVWSSFLGGAAGEWDYVNAVALDATGDVLATGGTTAFEFPTTAGAWDTSFGGQTDIFVSRLDATGSSLVWSSFIGSTARDEAFGIGLDAGGVVVGGFSNSISYPTSLGAFDTVNGPGGGDGVISRLSAAGDVLLESTLLGNDGYESVNGLALATDGTVFVIGATDAAVFPTTAGAFDTGYNGGTLDAFLTRVDADLGGLVFSTYLGGSGEDLGIELDLDLLDRPVLTGYTDSADFPTSPGALQAGPSGFTDAFVAQLDGAGALLDYGTYLGGTSFDYGFGIAADAASRALVTGLTQSLDFPLSAGAWDPSQNGLLDAYLTRLELPWVNLGLGLAGTTAPRLIGDGDLAALSPVTVNLVDALPLTAATLVVGFSRLDAPFKGGVLVPAPDLLIGPIVTSSGGTLSLSGSWPGGLPSGFSIYLQTWLPDGGGPAGFQASNALSATTP
jgi:hypothetical protein